MGRRGAAGAGTDRRDGRGAARALAARRQCRGPKRLRQQPRRFLIGGLMPSINSLSVIGAGAWGTALAGVAARPGREVVLFARNAAAAQAIAVSRENPRLPGVELDPRIALTSELSRAAA